MLFCTAIFALTFVGQGLSQTDDHSLARANNVLGLNLLKELSSGSPGSNVFFSPSSISIALGMIYTGARGSSEEELSTVLGLRAAGLTDRDAVLSEYRKQLNDTTTGDVILDVANAALFSDSLHVLEEYQRLLVDTFDAECRSVDFVRDGSKLASEMNSWVSKKTRGKIQEILGDSLPVDTAMVFLNAVYFKGSWQKRFKPRNTVPLSFYNRGTDVVQTSTMKMRNKLGYANLTDLDAAVIELMYEGGRFSMVIVLPNADTGLPNLKQSLSIDKIGEIDGLLKLKTVDLSIPKFKLEQEYGLVPTLRRLGLLSVFGDDADLSGMTGDRQLFAPEIEHKALVEVNEEGTVAVAVTKVRPRTSSFHRNVIFQVDHPFMFYIRDKVTRQILFMGEVNEL